MRPGSIGATGCTNDKSMCNRLPPKALRRISYRSSLGSLPKRGELAKAKDSVDGDGVKAFGRVEGRRGRLVTSSSTWLSAGSSSPR